MRDWSNDAYPHRKSKKPVKTYDFESHEAFRRLHEEQAEKAQKQAEKLEGDRRISKFTNEELIERLRDELSAKNEEIGALRSLHQDKQQYIPALKSAIEELRDEHKSIEEYVEKAKLVYRKVLKRWERKLGSKDEEIREKQSEIDRLILEKKLEEDRRQFLENAEQPIERTSSEREQSQGEVTKKDIENLALKLSRRK